VGSPVHSGSYALSGTATSSDDAQCTQVIQVQPNSSYPPTTSPRSSPSTPGSAEGGIDARDLVP
jgi:chitinase